MTELSSKEMTIDIVYDESEKTYTAGQAVTGHVVLQVQQPIILGGVRIYFHGKGRISWNSIASVNTAREIYLSEAQEIFDSANSLYTSRHLLPGTHRFPFSQHLSADLPASYRGRNGYVRYKARATVEGPWKAKKFCVESDFLVWRSVDLNEEPAQLRAPIQVQKELNLYGGCSGVGSIIVEFVVNRRCFVPGEKILLNGSVEYMTDARIRRTSVAIVQTVTLHKYPKRHQLRRTVSKVAGSLVPSFQKGLWVDVELPVPSVPPSRVDGCSLIDIEYWIEIFVDFLLPCANISRRLTSITIGNVPLQSTAQSSVATPALDTSTIITTTQRSTPRGHHPGTNTQRQRSESRETQWDMVRFLPPTTTASGLPTGSDTPRRSTQSTLHTYDDDSTRNGDCFFVTPSLESTIADIHKGPTCVTNDDRDIRDTFRLTTHIQ